MNRIRAKQLKPIFDAFCEGKTIQRLRSNGEWEDTDLFDLGWSSDPVLWRVRPEAVKTVPFRTYVRRNPDGSVVPDVAYGGFDPETAADFVAWVNDKDQQIEVLAEKVQAAEAKANQGKGGKK